MTALTKPLTLFLALALLPATAEIAFGQKGRGSSGRGGGGARSSGGGRSFGQRGGPSGGIRSGRIHSGGDRGPSGGDRGRFGGSRGRSSAGPDISRFNRGGAFSFDRDRSDGRRGSSFGGRTDFDRFRRFDGHDDHHRHDHRHHDRDRHRNFSLFVLPFLYGYNYPSYRYYDDYQPYGYYQPAPIVTPPVQTEVRQPAGSEIGEEYFASAREAFRGRDYREALRLAGHAAVEMPDHPDLHQFISLTLFALEDYRAASSAAHAALGMGKPWDWSTLRGHYPRAADYTPQLRKLEETLKADPDSTDARFLLGYHYVMLGHKNDAIRHLKKVAEAEPQDKLTIRMLEDLGVRQLRLSPAAPPVPPNGITTPDGTTPAEPPAGSGTPFTPPAPPTQPETPDEPADPGPELP